MVAAVVPVLTRSVPLSSLIGHATPYHAPIFLAQSRGYFKDEGIFVAILGQSGALPTDRAKLILFWVRHL